MTALADIQEKLQATTEAISRLKLAIKDQPGLPSLLANMKSLQNRYSALESDFAAAASVKPPASTEDILREGKNLLKMKIRRELTILLDDIPAAFDDFLNRVRNCESGECHKLFLAMRKKQRYCSSRCQSREGTRRFRHRAIS